MATINARSIPDDLYQRVRLAAANGGNRIPKGGLERFVIRALRRAVEDPQPGAGMPKLKLCAHCFQVNAAAAAAPKSNVVPASHYTVQPETIDLTKKPAIELFSHLSDDENPAAAAIGMLGDDRNPDPGSIDIFKMPAPSDKTIEFFSYPIGEPGEKVETIKIDPSKIVIGSYADFWPPKSFSECDAVPAISSLGAVEVMNALWISSDSVYEKLKDDMPPNLSVISAAKEPWHRAMLGYKTKSAPEGDERLFARRGNVLALNLLDVRELGPGGEHYVPEAVINAAIEFINERRAADDEILIHAGDGRSAAPTIAFIYMLRAGELPEGNPRAGFESLYSLFEPKPGMQKFIEIELSERQIT